MREIARAGSFERDLKKLAKRHQGIEDDTEACLEGCDRRYIPGEEIRDALESANLIQARQTEAANG